MACRSRATSSASRSTRTAFCQVSLARSASDQPRSQQFGDQVRVAGDVVQAVRGERRAVVVAADADVVDAGDLAHVVEVVGDRRHGGHRAAGGPPRRRAWTLHRLAGWCRGGAGRARACSRRRPAVQSTAAGQHELRHERRHRDAAVGREPLQHVVGDVARVVADGARGGVREDHRRGRWCRSASRMRRRAPRGERSTSMPTRFISRTTSWPKADRPPTRGHVGRASPPTSMLSLWVSVM